MISKVSIPSFKYPMPPYKHLFFDLDHTLWDFDANAKETLNELYAIFQSDRENKYSF